MFLAEVNWGEVGAIVGIVALVETPMLLVVTWGIRWVQDVNHRLERIEARSRQVRWDDPPKAGPAGSWPLSGPEPGSE